MMHGKTVRPITNSIAIAFAITIVALPLLNPVAAQVQFGPVSGNAERGKQLYFDHACYSCHGYNGIGRKNLANDVSGIMISEEVFLIYLRARADQNPLLPAQTMPNYAAESLPDEEALDIYAYIRTFKDTPPEVVDIPALQGILDVVDNRR